METTAKTGAVLGVASTLGVVTLAAHFTKKLNSLEANVKEFEKNTKEAISGLLPVLSLPAQTNAIRGVMREIHSDIESLKRETNAVRALEQEVKNLRQSVDGLLAWQRSVSSALARQNFAHHPQQPPQQQQLPQQSARPVHAAQQNQASAHKQSQALASNSSNNSGLNRAPVLQPLLQRRPGAPIPVASAAHAPAPVSTGTRASNLSVPGTLPPAVRRQAAASQPAPGEARRQPAPQPPPSNPNGATQGSSRQPIATQVPTNSTQARRAPPAQAPAPPPLIAEEIVDDEVEGDVDTYDAVVDTETTDFDDSVGQETQEANELDDDNYVSDDAHGDFHTDDNMGPMQEGASAEDYNGDEPVSNDLLDFGTNETFEEPQQQPPPQTRQPQPSTQRRQRPNMNAQTRRS